MVGTSARQRAEVEQQRCRRELLIRDGGRRAHPVERQRLSVRRGSGLVGVCWLSLTSSTP